MVLMGQRRKHQANTVMTIALVTPMPLSTPAPMLCCHPTARGHGDTRHWPAPRSSGNIGRVCVQTWGLD
jgi:hypothetical protein